MLKQKLVLSYSTKIGIQVFSTAITIVVARVAGASVLGTVAFATAFVSLFMVFFDLGQGTAHVKLVSEGQCEKACNGVYLRIQIVMSFIFLMAALGFYFINKYVLKHPFESVTHEKVVLITILTLSIANFVSISQTIFIARTQQARLIIPDVVKQVIYQILRLIVVLLGYGAIAIAWSNFFATILIIPIYLYSLKGTEFGKWDTVLFKKYVFIALPVFFTNVVDIFSNYIDKVLLQYFSNSAEVGYYIAGFSIGGLIVLIGNSAGLLLLPAFSRLLAENKTKEVNGMIRQFERFNWVFLFILTLITAIGSDLIINVLLGSKYVKSIPILSIINFSSFFMTYFLVYGVVLSSKGYFLFGAKLYFVKLIFLVIIGVCFVHPALLNLGAVGLALTLLFSNIFIGILVVFFAKIKITGIQVFQEKRLIIYSILFGVVAFFLYQLTNSIISKVLYLFVVMVLFYTLAYLLKLIKRNDFQMLNQMLSLKKMGTYIKGEMKNDTY